MMIMMMIVSVDGLGGTYYIYIYIYIMCIYIYICYNYIVSLVKKLASPKIQESPNRKSPFASLCRAANQAYKVKATAAVSNLGFRSNKWSL